MSKDMIDALTASGANVMITMSAEELKSFAHDIAHCDYTLCLAKDRRRRYKAHLEDIKHDIQHCVYLSFEDDRKSRILELGSCPNFWLYEK